MSLALAALATGCALESAPLPPSLHIPTPVSNLTARRAGDAVTLHWTMPRLATDKVPLKGKQRVEICRLAETPGPARSSDKQEPCQVAGNIQLHPGVAGTYIDHLPPALDSGAPRPMVYAVRVYGPYKRNAGYSNRVTVVAGAPPPPVGAVTTTVRPDGVILHWHPRAPQPGMQMRMTRTLVAPKHAPRPNPQAGAGPAKRQVLAVSLAHHDPGQALDSHAALDHTYKYVLQRVVRLTVRGKSARLPGQASPPVTVDAKDVFPPSVPQGLDAVADPQSGAIDLSWEPSPQADVAGYIVYRRRAASGSRWRRISPPGHLVTTPQWQDTHVTPGVRYEYAVSAVDRDGNQSARSASVKEELRPQQ